MPRVSLVEAQATLEVEPGASLSTVTGAYMDLVREHHPNDNSVQSQAKFKEISVAYERLVDHFELLRAVAYDAEHSDDDNDNPFCFSCGVRHNSDDEGLTADEFDAQMAVEEYVFWLLHGVVPGRSGSRASYAERRGRSAENANDFCDSQSDARDSSGNPRELQASQDSQASDSRQGHQAAPRLPSEEVKEEEEKARLARNKVQAEAKERESKEAEKRRQAKKATSVAMKTADEDKAARVALERLATAQAKRCVVFDAARSGNPDVIKRGIYEDGVDPNGGEWLTGGREAVAEIGRLRNSGVGDQSAGTVKLSKGQKKRAKAKAKAQAQVTTEAASESTGNTTLSMSKENVVGAPKHENTSRLVNSDLDADSKETLLHICVQRNEKILVEWLLDHGAVPDERNSRGFTAAHLSILLNQVELAQHFISECPPGSPFEGASIDCGSRDPYQPPPPKHSLLSLALAGASRDVKRALELVRLVLPFVGGREIRKCWKKIGFQQGRKPRKDWEAWDDIKWALAKRAQELNFQDFTPHEPFDGPRPHVFRPQEPTTCSRRA